MARETQLERELLDSIQSGQLAHLQILAKDGSKRCKLLKNWEFVKRCAKEVAHTDNPEVVR